MKKLLTITIAIILMMPQEALCLRPVAFRNRYKVLEEENRKIVHQLVHSNNIFEIRRRLAGIPDFRKEQLVEMAIVEIAEIIENSEGQIPKAKILEADKRLSGLPRRSRTLTRIYPGLTDEMLHWSDIMVKKYDLILRALFLMGVFEGDIIYPFCGVDFFPAKYGNLIQIDKKSRKRKRLQRFFIASVAEPIGIPPEQIEQINARVSVNAITMNVSRINTLAKVLASRKGPRAVILEGTSFLVLPLMDSMDSTWLTSKEVKHFCVELDNKIIHERDHLLLMGEDVLLKDYFVSLGYYKEIPLNPKLYKVLSRRRDDFFNVWDGKRRTTLSFHIPSRVVILKKEVYSKRQKNSGGDYKTETVRPLLQKTSIAIAEAA